MCVCVCGVVLVCLYVCEKGSVLTVPCGSLPFHYAALSVSLGGIADDVQVVLQLHVGNYRDVL